jgi:hypothetical protein
MAKNKVSEYSSTAASNTDIGGIDIAEGCAPSGINNAIRELMAQIKDMQSGSDSDALVAGGTLTLLNTLITSSSAGTAGQALLSQGASTPPAWGTLTIFPVGAIYISTVSTNPASLFGFGTWVAYGTGRTLVAIDTSNTLMDVVGETFGGADAIVPSHSHSITDAGHNHTAMGTYALSQPRDGAQGQPSARETTVTTSTSTTGITINTTGVSVTNQNYQPSIAVYIWNRTA